MNSISYIKPTAKYPNGLVVSGGQDMLIYVFDPINLDPIFTLVGHTSNVCTLATQGDEIISGSWDKTARVWKDGNCVNCLIGHDAAVWGVLFLDKLKVTSSADKTIRIWSGDQCQQIIQAHQDVVRGLTNINNGFASCSNDGLIKVWSAKGELDVEMHGHTSFVYGVATLENGDLISCGEDRTVRVWRDGNLIQTLTQPCVSVWAVAALANGDLVAGGSDGKIRSFTRSLDRLASDDILKVHAELVAHSSIPS